MTGAPVPASADAVVQVERTTLLAEDRVRIDNPTARPGLNVLPLGAEMRRGDVVLREGSVLGPQELGLLAAVGQVSVLCVRAPTVAVLATGDELVEPDVVPGPGQIRNSNAVLLLGQSARAGGLPRSLGIARDDRAHLRERIAEGLQSDVLLLSGGVSAGKLDLVPDVLRELGIEAHFHKVAMKPGKPLFFGTTLRGLVFGLPGNPVSSFACFELFARPAMRKMLGHAEPGPRKIEAPLASAIHHRSDRPTYHPAKLEEDSSGRVVRPLPWFGSPDLRGLAGADSLVVFPAGDGDYAIGERVPVIVLES
jgi:molybdopterin molybdotransferase